VVHFTSFRTLTTPVQLIKCLRSIKEHAFTASEFPVVITLEDHLTPDLQSKVSKVSLCYFVGMCNSHGLMIYYSFNDF
jgi:hypothetical protein